MENKFKFFCFVLKFNLCADFDLPEGGLCICYVYKYFGVLHSIWLALDDPIAV